MVGEGQGVPPPSTWSHLLFPAPASMPQTKGRTTLYELMWGRRWVWVGAHGEKRTQVSIGNDTGAHYALRADGEGW